MDNIYGILPLSISRIVRFEVPEHVVSEKQQLLKNLALGKISGEKRMQLGEQSQKRTARYADKGFKREVKPNNQRA